MRSAMDICATRLISSFKAASALALRRRFGKGNFTIAMSDCRTVQQFLASPVSTLATAGRI